MTDDMDDVMSLYDRLRSRRREGRFADVKLPHIICPRCHRASFNQDDIREGYCGYCHDWTSPHAGNDAGVTAPRMENSMYGQGHAYGRGHYFCRQCNHLVYGYRGGCGTCRTTLAELMLFDAAWDSGYINRGMYDGGGIGFDPFDGEIAFDIPGTDLAIEPDGQIDLDLGGVDIPLDDGFGGW